MAPQVTELGLQSAGRKLAARLIDGSGGTPGSPAILFLHGLGSDQSGYRSRAGAAAGSLGAACLTVDLGGHGDSDGVKELLSPRDHLLDVLCAYDALCAAVAIERARVGVCAASYGAYLAALLLGERPIARALLRAPALYPDEWLDVPLGERGRLEDPPSRSLATDNLAAFGGEVLVLESGRDAVISHATIEAYLHASPRAHHALMADATHHLAEPAWKAEFEAIIVDWFAAL